jgi:hypothetical protein
MELLPFYSRQLSTTRQFSLLSPNPGIQFLATISTSYLTVAMIGNKFPNFILHTVPVSLVDSTILLNMKRKINLTQHKLPKACQSTTCTAYMTAGEVISIFADSIMLHSKTITLMTNPFPY